MKKPLLVYTRIDENRRRTTLLLVVFALLFLPVLLYFSHYAWALLLMSVVMGAPFLIEGIGELPPSVHIFGTLVVGGGATALIAFLEFSFAEAIALKVTGARPLAPGEGSHLRKIVENLCIGSGLPQPALHVIDTGAPNAFAVGLSPERAKVVVTCGLLEELDRRELEGVIAHELSHIGNYDIRLNTVAAVMEALLGLPSRIFLAPFKFLFRTNWVWGRVVIIWVGLGTLLLLHGAVMMVMLSLGDPSLSNSFALLVLGCVGLVFYALALGPLTGRIMRLAISRQREFLADADAYLLTRHPEALARALKKISLGTKQKLKGGRALARVFIVSPWNGLLSGHPPVDERIAALARMGGGFSPAEFEVSSREHLGAPVESFNQGSAQMAAPAESGRSPLDAIIAGSLAGTITLVVLVVIKLLLMAFFAAEGEQVSVWFQLVPAVVAAGVAVQKAGCTWEKSLGVAFVSTLLAVYVFAFGFAASPFIRENFNPPSPGENSLAYQMGAFFYCVLTIILAALFGVFIAHKKRN